MNDRTWMLAIFILAICFNIGMGIYAVKEIMKDDDISAEKKAAERHEVEETDTKDG